ncbi:exo-poly-alpha-D-galacturonosidase, partial [Cutibacterium acnes]|nr:exo-poly-alpha-D-galacturonosidase [Cutibacterium acnes]
MKSTEYIEWDKLEQIPFCLCRIAEDEENQEIDVYYLDKRVCHDYDHVGHYFRTAII